jgi:hypothetical protein
MHKAIQRDRCNINFTFRNYAIYPSLLTSIIYICIPPVSMPFMHAADYPSIWAHAIHLPRCSKTTVTAHPSTPRTLATNWSKWWAHPIYPWPTSCKSVSFRNAQLCRRPRVSYRTVGCHSSPLHTIVYVDVRTHMGGFVQSIHLFPLLCSLTISLLEPIAMQAITLLPLLARLEIAIDSHDKLLSHTNTISFSITD